MRTILLAMLIALTLVACGTKNDAPEQPAPEAAAVQEAASPAEAAQGPTSTNGIKDVIPEGPVGTVRLTDGSTVELTKLIKLGNYHLYITGKLNGRSSTVVSLTRFSDVQRWESFVFQDPNNFTITTKTGKEMVFSEAQLYLGSGSSETYTFMTIDDRFNSVQTEIRKRDVAVIKIN